MQAHISPFKMLLYAVAAMWVIQIIQMLTGNALASFAIYPRQLSGLIGIFTAPFLHWGFFHVFANTIPLIILGWLVSAQVPLVRTSVLIAVITGALVWLIARSAAHAGASGLVMGYFGFLLSYGFFSRSFKAILISALVVIFYGGMLLSLLDFRPHMSFESHIFGFIAGLVSAWLINQQTREKNRKHQ